MKSPSPHACERVQDSRCVSSLLPARRTNFEARNSVTDQQCRRQCRASHQVIWRMAKACFLHRTTTVFEDGLNPRANIPSTSFLSRIRSGRNISTLLTGSSTPGDVIFADPEMPHDRHSLEDRSTPPWFVSLCSNRGKSSRLPSTSASSVVAREGLDLAPWVCGRKPSPQLRHMRWTCALVQT